MTTLSLTLSACVLAVGLLAGCADQHHRGGYGGGYGGSQGGLGDMGPKQTGGAVIGGVAGALAGAQFGHGSGKMAATAVGTLLGAYLGSQAGASLDRADQAYYQPAEQQAHHAPMGQTIQWNNPQTGNYGTFTPIRDGQDTMGNYCREYQSTIYIGGRPQQSHGTACRQPDGTWRIVN